MISYLLTVFVFLNSPQAWKQQVYDQHYQQAIEKFQSSHTVPSVQLADYRFWGKGKVSWYGTGTHGNYAACWNDYKKGTRFRVSFNGHSTIVVCNDRGHFEERGVMLDLSQESFKELAPLSTGIIKDAEIEVLYD